MGYKIVAKEQWSDKVFMMKVVAPDIAKHRKAGNFIIFRLDELGERTITIVTQSIGYSTAKLMELKVGDEIMDVIGPLGQPTHIEKKDGIILGVGGGVGIAPLHPIVQAHHNAGNKVISILGARDKSLIIMEDMMRKVSDELLVCTDNGSYGMIDGTGMCGCCRVLVGTQTKFACVEGPEFDGHLVDFDLLMKRQAMYKKEEHECNLKFAN